MCSIAAYQSMFETASPEAPSSLSSQATALLLYLILGFASVRSEQAVHLKLPRQYSIENITI